MPIVVRFMFTHRATLILSSFVLYHCKKFSIHMNLHRIKMLVSQVHMAASECLLELTNQYVTVPPVKHSELKFMTELIDLCEIEKNEQAKSLLKKCIQILGGLKQDMEMWAKIIETIGFLTSWIKYTRNLGLLLLFLFNFIHRSSSFFSVWYYNRKIFTF